MLKGFFYRRTSENNPFETDTNIRFEINAKESVLAKISNLSQEGLQFLLPRGKVILVPDERILLILNSPEHGEFKIQCDVYYFCNICDSNDSQLVCYGVKFYELSGSTWDIIREFCGVELPEITFLDNPLNKPANPRETPAPTAAAAMTTEPVTETPATSFIPFTPIIPVETPVVASVTNPTINVASKTDSSDKPIKTAPPFSELPPKPATQPGAFSIPAAPVAATKEADSTEAFLSSVESLAAISGITSKAKEKSPAKSNSNSLLSESVFPANDPATGKEPEQKLNPTKTSPTVSTTAQASEKTTGSSLCLNQTSTATPAITSAAKEEITTQSKQNSIQVLAASLASPAIIHTQQKAQSLSQEMIDRLIKKLEAEANEGQTDSTQPTQPESTPPYNPIPDYLKVPSDINATYQTFKDSAVVGKSFQKQTEDVAQPEPQTAQPTPFTENATDTVPFNPFTTFDFKPEVARQSDAQTSQPASFTENVADTASLNPFDFKPEAAKKAETRTPQPVPFTENSAAETTSFDPFTALNSKSDNIQQPEAQTGQGSPVTNNVAAETAPFNQFMSFNYKSDSAKQPEAQTNQASSVTKNVAAETAPFDPFMSFNYKSDSIQQPEAQTGQAPPVTKNIAAETAPFDPFASFNFSSANARQSDVLTDKPIQSDHITPSVIDSNNSFFSETKPSNQTDLHKNTPKTSNSAAAGFDGKSLLDLVTSLDSTINKNSPSIPEKSIANAAGGTVFSAIATEKAADITPEEPKKTESPYSGKEPSRNTPISSKKTVVPIMADIPPVPQTAVSEASSKNTPLREQSASASDVKTSPVGSTIIPNSSGVSLDQKAIDKLVTSLLENMPPDELASAPPELSSQPNPVPQPDVAIGKNVTDSKVNPKMQSESAPFNNNAMGRNIFNPDPNNNRVMDQKSIDVIVKTLTEGSPNPVMAESGQSTPATNATPPKTLPTSGTKRTLDQKAIDQVVQALTQHFPNNSKPNPTKSIGFTKPEQSATISLDSLHASIQLERGGVLQAAIEQIYVGGLMVAVEQEIPLNSHLRLNLFGENLRISELTGTCTNCEPNPSGKAGYLAEIFFKNMSTAHMEQFRTLIAKIDVNQ